MKTKLLDGRVELVEGDAQMAFADNSFSGACISFGIRNVPDRLLGLKEMCRVVEPGGKSPSSSSASHPAVSWVSSQAPCAPLRPWLGALLWIERVPLFASIYRGVSAPEAFVEMMQEAGLRDIKATKLTFGTAHHYVGTA